MTATAQTKSRVGDRGRGALTDETGAEALEFALVAPLFLFVVFGLISILLAVAASLSLTHATSLAARYATIPLAAAGSEGGSGELIELPGLELPTQEEAEELIEDPEAGLEGLVDTTTETLEGAVGSTEDELGSILYGDPQSRETHYPSPEAVEAKLYGSTPFFGPESCTTTISEGGGEGDAVNLAASCVWPNPVAGMLNRLRNLFLGGDGAEPHPGGFTMNAEAEARRE